MAFRGGGQQQKVQKLMVQPINLIFRFLQNRSRIQMWLFDQKNLRIEGHVIGFDEYMNLVLDDAEEVHIKRGERKSVGRILIKGDNITLIQNVSPQSGWFQGNYDLYWIVLSCDHWTTSPELCYITPYFPMLFYSKYWWVLFVEVTIYT